MLVDRMIWCVQEKKARSDAMEQSKYTLKSILSLIWATLPRRRQAQYLSVLVLTVISSFADIFTLGAVIPFLAVLLNPEKVMAFELVRETAIFFGFANGKELVLPLTFLFCGTALVAGFVRVSLLYFNARISSLSGADLSEEVYRRTLYQPYSVQVTRNSSDVISGITKVDTAVIVISQCLIFINSSLSAFLIILSLFLINSQVAFFVMSGAGLSYIALTFFSRRRLIQNSKQIAMERTKVLKAKQEGLGGIRDILLDGTQSLYCEIFSRADRPLRQAVGSNIFLSGSPRHFLESLGMVSIAVVAYIMSQTEQGLSAVIPSLGALALGAQRLLPALQQGYGAWSTVTGCWQSLIDLAELIKQPLPRNIDDQKTITPHPFKESLSLQKISFHYLWEQDLVLKNIDLSIARGEKIGIVGTTGSGKSTLVNIIMGLLQPTIGELLVDGIGLDSDKVNAWQRNIAHVPQNIYLSDSSFAENIAFGVAKNQIDMDRVKEAAKQAQIQSYIESRKDKYDTRVGERGVKLSGGQRQRIGIARALYKDAAILVLDEATSALDNVTETALLNSVEQLSANLTVILIAHRLTTVSNCDKIIVLEDGEVVSIGPAKYLEGNCTVFKGLASRQALELSRQ